ncbi:TetR/AcrR family transcriptional regulator [Streptomyces triticirhizae]|uniref:TetR/AcrR family transcriptional regulator n=1 Tax=Streptomyces triticirhizae TaxID=2483353 RepID=A0A3M2LXH0_9ACTN|nr:TetR/AcrR family transcriptional regulator [Streptomyces triticirhizae]RMI42037.1 TetR/AcrR family transcriptional regulator [Streptomyces triticirhizae]
MARPRLFDEGRALEAAMRVFWARGYDATSTDDLCAATGLGRSSVYNAFGSKHALFTRALTRYMELMNGPQRELLADVELPPLERLRRLVALVIEQDLANRDEEGRGIGCLTVNTTVELAARDPEAAALLARDLAERTATLRAVIEAGQREGTVSARRPAETLADYLNTVLAGIRVAGQRGAGRAELTAIAEAALDTFTP